MIIRGAAVNDQHRIDELIQKLNNPDHRKVIGRGGRPYYYRFRQRGRSNQQSSKINPDSNCRNSQQPTEKKLDDAYRMRRNLPTSFLIGTTERLRLVLELCECSRLQFSSLG